MLSRVITVMERVAITVSERIEEEEGGRSR